MSEAQTAETPTAKRPRGRPPGTYRTCLRTDAEVADAFWQQVAVGKPDQCWRWLGSWQGPSAVFTMGKYRVPARRQAWTLRNGSPIPKHKNVLVSCDDLACMNPSHLYIQGEDYAGEAERDPTDININWYDVVEMREEWDSRKRMKMRTSDGEGNIHERSEWVIDYVTEGGKIDRQVTSLSHMAERFCISYKLAYRLLRRKREKYANKLPWWLRRAPETEEEDAAFPTSLWRLRQLEGYEGDPREEYLKQSEVRAEEGQKRKDTEELSPSQFRMKYGEELHDYREREGISADG